MTRESANAKESLGPLTEAELDVLEEFLGSDALSEKAMAVDTLDGYLTAIAIGPATLPLDRWFPYIWGLEDKDVELFASLEQAESIVGLILRHYNSIVEVLERDPDGVSPLFSVLQGKDGKEYLDGEPWASGFMLAVDLNRDGWHPLIQDPEGVKAFTPIFLLGSDESSKEISEFSDPELSVADLTEAIPDSVAWIHRFWLERRLVKTVKRDNPKVGRNDPCPCGSGKKYKQCCLV